MPFSSSHRDSAENRSHPVLGDRPPTSRPRRPEWPGGPPGPRSALPDGFARAPCYTGIGVVSLLAYHPLCHETSGKNGDEIVRYQALKIASAVFGAGLALQAPIVAHAAEPTRAASLSSKVALAPQTAGSTQGGITPMHVATECGGRTDLPHRSNGFASVHGVTHCSYAALSWRRCHWGASGGGGCSGSRTGTRRAQRLASTRTPNGTASARAPTPTWVRPTTGR